MGLSETNSAIANSVVLVPLRSFDDAKSRLSDSFDAQQRRVLMRQMAETVVAAAHDLPVWIVTDDRDVAKWAAALGVACVAVGVHGLNPGITIAAARATAAGFSRIIIAHADLPFATDLRVVQGSGVVIAPDRHRDGSNVMSLPSGSGFVFAYGPNSFTKHRTEASRLGLSFTEINEATLAWDIDSPNDLRTVLPQRIVSS
ncbi:MAG: 2-phospho-L-lactate guanylyltransferase [Acidimicrobiia bacterium]|nr:2-phospho-L-lactate guanylyltransferase [Acidimicrobiia bacterium]MCY4457271.1 2-phospho-L-lactate guanylyltransferase [Acidimicrobiaceae bacterium]